MPWLPTGGSTCADWGGGHARHGVFPRTKQGVILASPSVCELVGARGALPPPREGKSQPYWGFSVLWSLRPRNRAAAATCGRGHWKGVFLPSKCLLESPFLEPLLTTLLRALPPLKHTARRFLRTLLRTFSKEISRTFLKFILRRVRCCTTPWCAPKRAGAWGSHSQTGPTTQRPNSNTQSPLRRAGNWCRARIVEKCRKYV